MSKRTLALIFITLFLSACWSSHDKTGEIMIFESDKLKVKVVQIYEDMPWHYYGLTHQIWCQSPATMDMAWGGIERGWNRIERSGISKPGQSPSRELKKNTLDVAVLDASKHLQVIGNEVIVFANNGRFTITINGCKEFSTWIAWSLHADEIVQAEKPKYCKEGDCQWENFKGDNEISYTDIKIDGAAKKISFRAHSKAFKEGDQLVQSDDGGIRWVATKFRKK